MPTTRPPEAPLAAFPSSPCGGQPPELPAELVIIGAHTNVDGLLHGLRGSAGARRRPCRPVGGGRALLSAAPSTWLSDTAQSREVPAGKIDTAECVSQRGLHRRPVQALLTRKSPGAGRAAR